MTAELTETLRCEVVKPLDGDWAALGRKLRGLRRPLHRVLNGVVRELELGARTRHKNWVPAAEQAHGANAPARTAAYRFARDMWQSERAACVARIARGKAINGDEGIAAVEPSGSLIRATGNAAYARWRKYQKDKWKGASSLPSFKAPSPVYVDGDAVKVSAQDGSYVLSLNLDAGRSPWTRVVIRPWGGRDYTAAALLVEHPEWLGDARLKEEVDHDGKRKWLAFIAWKHPVEERPAGRTIAVHRGVRNFLTYAIARDAAGHDAESDILATGEDILAHKARHQARRKALGRHTRELGKGARGHGRKRFFEHINKADDADARWVRSKCQEIAAHLMRLCERRGVSRILLEDWTNPAKGGAPELGDHLEYLVRSFPLAQLRECIEWAARKRGFTVEIIPGAYNSRDCPHCGHRHEQPRFGKCICESCKLERQADIIATWNMLRRVGEEAPLADAIKAEKRIAAALRAKRTA